MEKKYRIEGKETSSGDVKYYLVKDIKFKGKKRKVTKYLGTERPSDERIEVLQRAYTMEIELKAAQRKAVMATEYYRSDYLSRSEIWRLEYLRQIYHILQQYASADEIEFYERDFDINYIHGTTAIEGNTLTVQQAKDLLEHGIVPNDKELREINEVQNFIKVLDYRKNYRGKISHGFILGLHSLIMDNIMPESAGSYRKGDGIIVAGYDHQFTPAIEIESELDEIIDDYYTQMDKRIHPFELAVLFHYRFETIHPFTDGNGRVGREIFNYMLTREKYPELLFPGFEREAYIQALRYGNDEKNGEMIRAFMGLMIMQRLFVLIRNVIGLLKHG